jgi:phage terminase Nu1 subunit (DNA packaging protein)
MLTQRAIAEGLGISPQLLTRYKRAGMPLTSVEAAAAWRAANVRQRIAEKPNGKAHPPKKAQPSQYQQARTRRELADAEDREISVLERRGVLVRREKVRAEVARILVGLRQSLLQIPARLQAVLAAETDETKVHDVLQDEIDGILALIAEVK